MVAEVVICAAQSVVRAGLAAMVQGGSIEVIAQFDSLSALSLWLQSQQTDLAIVEMPLATAVAFDGLWVLLEDAPDAGSEAALDSADDLSILLLLNADAVDVATRRSLVSLMRTGRVSVLPMSVLAGELRGAIAAITNGLTVIHPDFSDRLFSLSDSSFSITETELEPLTPREVEVLNQLVDGRSNRAIAQTLNISEHTVKFHISAILSKLQVSSRTEAVTVGIRSGLVML